MSMFRLPPAPGLSWSLLAGLGWICVMLPLAAFSIGFIWLPFAWPAIALAMMFGVIVPSKLLVGLWALHDPAVAVLSAGYAGIWAVIALVMSGPVWASPMLAIVFLSVMTALERVGLIATASE